MSAYHYTASGLANVWLANGYRFIDTPYGEAVEIERVAALHRAIGLALCRKSSLNGREFRYLRIELDLSQAELGKRLGKSSQTVALWEKGRDVPRWADVLMRALYREHIEGRSKLSEIFAADASTTTRARPSRMTFHKTQKALWAESTASARAAA